ncbi:MULTISPECIES: hypothetical protein [Thermus]|uniref:Uncharacterized protein n=1 Tax=Thermus tengchongensis TaxID=1214928 RepID=A0ABY2K3R8_9DEIN|nr:MULTISPECIES: hypothetical protein [Thermus]TFU14668.1 hypothetical protein E0489_11640 [Thermus tengchongensis]
MLNLLGLKQEDLANLPGRLQEALAALREDMACLKDQLGAVQRTLEYEFGRPRRDLQGHDPARMPLIAQVQVEGEARRIDVTGLLGKPATRGHIVNIGDAKARLWFTFGPQRVGPYILLPAAAVELSFALEVLEVSDAGEGPASVQFLFQ